MVWGQNQNQHYSSQNLDGLGLAAMNMNIGAGKGLLGESPGTGGLGLGGFGGMGSDSIDSMIQQRRLQQQLSLRESQLALASNLLQKQNQMMMMDAGLPNSMGQMMSGQQMGGPMIPSLLDLPTQSRQGKRPGFMGRDADMKRRRRESPSPSDHRRGRRSTEFDRRQNRSISPDRRRERTSRIGRTRWDSGDGGHRRSRRDSDVYDPANPTDDNEMPPLELADPIMRDDLYDRQPTYGGKSPFYCHVCDIDCSSDQTFRSHLDSSLHQRKMSQILNVHETTSAHISARMRAQEHLKQIEKKPSTADTGRRMVGFCKLCDEELPIPYPKHLTTTIHRKRAMQVNRGCAWCGVKDFKNFTEVLRHRETGRHQENARKFDKRQQPTESRSRDSHRSSRESRSQHGSSSSKSHSASSRPSGSSSSRSSKDPMPELQYDTETPVGQNFVVPVSGFFCKLCHKFYSTENAAKFTHCQSQPHFTLFKKIRIQAKEKAKEKARAAKKESKPADVTAKSDDEAVENEDGDDKRTEDERQDDEETGEQDKAHGENEKTDEKMDKNTDELNGAAKDQEEDQEETFGDHHSGEENNGMEGDKEHGMEGDEEQGMEGDEEQGMEGDEENGMEGDDGHGMEGDDGHGMEGDDEHGMEGDADHDDTETPIEHELTEEEQEKLLEQADNESDCGVMIGEDENEDCVILSLAEGKEGAEETEEASVKEAAEPVTPTRGRGRAKRGRKAKK